MNFRGRRWCAAAALVLAGWTAAARADGVATHFELDNDQFNFWQKPGDRPDFGYTHGTELALHFPSAPRALARLAPAWLLGRAGAGGSEPGLELFFEQAIYSPWTLPADRAYAGWLEGSLGLSRTSPQETRLVLLHLGVTGPPSLAGRVQRYFHRRFDHGEPPPDWSQQLPFEPGIGLEASGAWTTARAGSPDGWRATLGPLGRARLGTYADDLRLGLGVTLGFAPPGPWPAPGPGTRGPALYVRAAPKVDLIARDEFLDGPLFLRDPGPAPGARSVVAESEVGFGAGWGHARLEWTVLRRGKEFDGQPAMHTYSTLAFTWLP